jgi:hypothetical protein
MAVSTGLLRGLSIFSHVITWISAIIVLGITAWAVESFKSVTVIYALVIVCYTHILLHIYIYIFICTRTETVISNGHVAALCYY